MNRLRQTMRVVLPRESVVGLALVCYLVSRLPELAVLPRLWELSPREFAEAVREMRFVVGVCVAILAACYGLYRAVGFFPVEDEYRKWLGNKPWDGAAPLPFAPVHPVWQDGVVVGVLVLGGWGTPQPILSPLLWGMMGYVAGLGCVLGDHSLRAMYTALFGLAFVWLAGMSGLPGLEWLLLAGISMVLIGELQRILRKWPGLDFELQQRAYNGDRPGAGVSSWPYAALSPCQWVPPRAFPIHVQPHGWLLPLAGALWSWALLASAQIHAHNIQLAHPNDPQGDLFVGHIGNLVVVVVSVSCVFQRLSLYLPGHRAPISFGGRIATGRWIIPRYDAVWVAPLLVMLIMLTAVPLLSICSPTQALIAVPIAMAIVLAITLNLGPRVDRWRLTAPIRLAPVRAAKDRRNELMEV
ncbi:MAG: hypothetical protein KDB14_12935 [Planctomycetales bacterium]|nr:hypothetical protein [Planctomycetales bacterium]